MQTAAANKNKLTTIAKRKTAWLKDTLSSIGRNADFENVTREKHLQGSENNVNVYFVLTIRLDGALEIDISFVCNGDVLHAHVKTKF